MQNAIRKYALKLATVFALVFSLAMVRYFEFLFYDPFREYFARDFFGVALPDYDAFKLFANYFLRYWINTAISLAVIFAIFKSRPQLVFAGIVYLAFFGLLLAVLFAALRWFPEDKLMIFYVRRFVIQPILLLLFIPAFFYQRKSVVP